MHGLKRLRARVDAMSEGTSRRYSPEIKSDLLEAVAVLRERRESWAGVADALGVNSETLRNWWHEAKQKRKAGERLVPVHVAADSGGGSRACVVIAPNGMRVEGLDVAGIAELLRALA